MIGQVLLSGLCTLGCKSEGRCSLNYRVIVPARFGSTRIERKPLADIAGKTMIERVYEQAMLSGAEEVVVATDHPEIVSVVEGFGGTALMTSEDHLSGTDRLAEAAEQLGMADDEILVNVQGDEPLMPPQVVAQVASNLDQHADFDCATLCEPIISAGEFLEPSAVKVVAGANGQALYFSRAPIPWPRDTMADISTMPADQPLCHIPQPMRHVGIYSYRMGLLRQFTRWPPADLERTESLEQLRILANGGRIHVAPACVPVPTGVDVPADLERVRATFGP